MSNGNGDLVVLEPKPLQTRETFRAVKDTPLGYVQVADELGFAYLDQDIDFGAIGKNEIFQNIKFIILTEYFSVPLDREFGMNYSMVDKPIPIAEAILSQEVAMKIALYEPRAQFREISFVRDMLIGKLSPSVKVVLLTTNESPSMYVSAIAGGVVVAPAVQLPIAGGSAFSGTITGLPGPQGPPGVAATITVGQTITGAPGTDANVVDRGIVSAAILEFTIPRGDKGDAGTGITIKGTVANSGALPTTGNTAGDMWIASDTGHGWSWDGTQWIDCGPIQGPKGDAATILVGTTITGVAGTPANVVNVGSSSGAVFDFTIPQGIQGIQGPQGPPGAANAIYSGEWNWQSSGDANADGKISTDQSGAWLSSTEIRLNEKTALGVDTSSTQLDNIKAGDGFHIQAKADASKFLKFTVTGSGTDHGTWRSWPVILDQGGGVAPSNNTPMTVSLLRAGAQVEEWISGAGIPVGTLGKVGDFYLNTSNGAVYEKTADTIWTLKTNIIGPQGIQGIQGIQGPTGNPATVAVGTTTTGAAGTNANVVNVGTASAAILNFTIPQGIKGDQGIQGVQGIQGIQGVAGAAATVVAGTTTTGAAGTNANVTNSGTSSAAIFNFTIPQGIQGVKGDPGTPGSAVLADPTRNGLLRQTTGLASDYVDGTNNYRDLGTMVKPVFQQVRLRSYNAIGNPTFEVDQRNAGNTIANVPANKFICDRWVFSKNGTMVVNTVNEASSLGIVPGTTFRITSKQQAIALTTPQASLGASDFLMVQQTVEGCNWRELAGEATSISMMVYSSVANLKFAVAMRSGEATPTKSLVKLCTIPNANTWTYITLPNIPQPTGGSFPFTPGVVGYTLSIVLACGSTTYMAPAADTWQNGNFIGAPGMSNWCANSGAWFYVYFVQHEPGPECTTFIDCPFSANYHECLRYYWKTWDYGQIFSHSSGVVSCNATAAQNPIQFQPYTRKLAKKPTAMAFYCSTNPTIHFVTDAYAATNRQISQYLQFSETHAGYPQMTTTNASISVYTYSIEADTGW